MELYNGKFKVRTNYDTFEPEISVAGVWVPIRLVEDKDMTMEESIQIVKDKYGDEVVQELLRANCNHKFVYNGGLEGHMSFKCHECGEFRAC